MKDIIVRNSQGLTFNVKGEVFKDIRGGTINIVHDAGEVTVNWDDVFYISEIDVDG